MKRFPSQIVKKFDIGVKQINKLNAFKFSKKINKNINAIWYDTAVGRIRQTWNPTTLINF